MGRVLGFDIGERWLGIAVGDDTLRIATPRPERLLAAPGEAVDVILELITRERAVAVVIGMPYTMRGEVGPQALAIEMVIAGLLEATSTPIHRIDERLTSTQAAATQREASKKGKAPSREDSTAAALILQTWFDRGS